MLSDVSISLYGALIPHGVPIILLFLSDKAPFSFTVSSESGDVGDLAIFDNALEFSRYVVPASAASQKIAKELILKDSSLSDRILFDSVDDFFKEGTLGASYDEVKEGIKKALDTDCDLIVAIGEAATTFKSCINEL